MGIPNGVEDQYGWDAPCPSDAGLFIPIMGAKPGSVLRAVAVADRVECTWCHWIDGRTVPHLRTPSLCEGCKLGAVRRWKGYLGAWLEPTERLIIAEVTAAACRAAGGQRLLDRRDLRGMRFEIERMGRLSNSQCRLRLLALVPHDYQLPQAFDVRTALRKIWVGEAEVCQDGPDGMYDWPEGNHDPR